MRTKDQRTDEQSLIWSRLWGQRIAFEQLALGSTPHRLAVLGCAHILLLLCEARRQQAVILWLSWQQAMVQYLQTSEYTSFEQLMTSVTALPPMVAQLPVVSEWDYFKPGIVYFCQRLEDRYQQQYHQLKGWWYWRWSDQAFLAHCQRRVNREMTRGGPAWWRRWCRWRYSVNAKTRLLVYASTHQQLQQVRQADVLPSAAQADTLCFTVDALCRHTQDSVSFRELRTLVRDLSLSTHHAGTIPSSALSLAAVEQAIQEAMERWLTEALTLEPVNETTVGASLQQTIRLFHYYLRVLNEHQATDSAGLLPLVERVEQTKQLLYQLHQQMPLEPVKLCVRSMQQTYSCSQSADSPSISVYARLLQYEAQQRQYEYIKQHAFDQRQRLVKHNKQELTTMMTSRFDTCMETLNAQVETTLKGEADRLAPFVIEAIATHRREVDAYLEGLEAQLSLSKTSSALTSGSLSEGTVALLSCLSDQRSLMDRLSKSGSPALQAAIAEWTTYASECQKRVAVISALVSELASWRNALRGWHQQHRRALRQLSRQRYDDPPTLRQLQRAWALFQPLDQAFQAIKAPVVRSGHVQVSQGTNIELAVERWVSQPACYQTLLYYHLPNERWYLLTDREVSPEGAVPPASLALDLTQLNESTRAHLTRLKNYNYETAHLQELELDYWHRQGCLATGAVRLQWRCVESDQLPCITGLVAQMQRLMAHVYDHDYLPEFQAILTEQRRLNEARTRLYWQLRQDNTGDLSASVAEESYASLNAHNPQWATLVSLHCVRDYGPLLEPKILPAPVLPEDASTTLREDARIFAPLFLKMQFVNEHYALFEKSLMQCIQRHHQVDLQAWVEAVQSDADLQSKYATLHRLHKQFELVAHEDRLVPKIQNSAVYTEAQKVTRLDKEEVEYWVKPTRELRDKLSPLFTSESALKHFIIRYYMSHLDSGVGYCIEHDKANQVIYNNRQSFSNMADSLVRTYGVMDDTVRLCDLGEQESKAREAADKKAEQEEKAREAAETKVAAAEAEAAQQRREKERCRQLLINMGVAPDKIDAMLRAAASTEEAAESNTADDADTEVAVVVFEGATEGSSASASGGAVASNIVDDAAEIAPIDDLSAPRVSEGSVATTGSLWAPPLQAVRVEVEKVEAVSANDDDDEFAIRPAPAKK